MIAAIFEIQCAPSRAGTELIKVSADSLWYGLSADTLISLIRHILQELIIFYHVGPKKDYFSRSVTSQMLQVRQFADFGVSR